MGAYSSQGMTLGVGGQGPKALGPWGFRAMLGRGEASGPGWDGPNELRHAGPPASSWPSTTAQAPFEPGHAMSSGHIGAAQHGVEARAGLARHECYSTHAVL